MRNGFANIRGGGCLRGAELKPAIIAEALTHPGWVVEYIRHGGDADPRQLGSRYARTAPTPRSLRLDRHRRRPFDAQTWRDLERYRRLFPRTLSSKAS